MNFGVGLRENFLLMLTYSHAWRRGSDWHVNKIEEYNVKYFTMIK